MGKDTKPLEGRLTLPGKVRRREQAHIDARRKAAEVHKRSPLVGLALSGGGIRSATFCLGALQGLDSGDVLRRIDYMSTVSGGGYVGACLSSLTTALPPEEIERRRRRAGFPEWATLKVWERLGKPKGGKAKHRPARKSKTQFGVGPGETMPFVDAEQVHHLRKHGDFLILRRGALKLEMLRTLGALAINWIWAFVLFLAALGTVVLVWLSYLRHFAGASYRQTLMMPMADGGAALFAQALRPALGPCVVFAAVGALVGFVCWLFAYWRNPIYPAGRSGETGEDIGQRAELSRFAGVFIVAMIVAGWVRQWWGPPWCPPPGDDGAALGGLWLPVAFTLGALSVMGVMYAVWSAISKRRWGRPRRSLFGAMQGICLYAVAVTAGLIGLAVLVWAFRPDGLQWAYAAAVALADVTLIRWLVGRVSSGTPTRGFWVPLRVGGMQVALFLAVVVFMALGLVILSRAVLALGDIAPLVAGAFPVLFVVLGFGINFNRISPHYFYRDRLVETYFRTEASGPRGLRIVRDDEHLRLADLHDKPAGKGGRKTRASSCPYHLVLCSLNLVGSRDLARRDRKSDHFIFSKYYCGSTTTGYVRTERYRGGRTKLCRAIAISAAAASSAMGFYTSFASAFALTLLNIRLGYWMSNPRLYRPEYPRHQAPPPLERCRPWAELHRRERFIFWPYYLFREMFARTTARTSLVNLSDGGHTGDNLGLYPLLQRRCRVIVVCDAEADPGTTCGSLAEAVRQIFTDENVTVDMPLDGLEPDGASGRSGWHVAVGKINYPDCRRSNPRHPDRKDSTGWLVYLKASLTGDDDPVAVKSYARQHAEFPHETTADQFFSDDQFEAYRGLGAHVAGSAVRLMTGGAGSGPIDLAALERIYNQQAARRQP